MKYHLIVATLVAAAIAMPAHAALNIFACEPEWGALATELGGGNVSVFSATTARQDPHQVQARPALIARLRGADLVVCTGAELEVGWMPVLLRQAANGKVQPGSAGYLSAADQVTLLDVPTRLDRADGDVHAAGNPHIQNDPRNIRSVALALADRLAKIDPPHATDYATRRDDFVRRWDLATARWTQQATLLRGVGVVVHHKDWVYLLDWLGMHETGTIEPKPGVPPGGAYLAALVESMPRQRARMILYAAYQESKPAEFVASKTGVPAVMLPFTVGGTDKATDLFGLFDDTVTRLVAAGAAK